MPTTTTAAVVETPGEPFTLRQVELDDLRPDEVLVRMVAAGLCHTDLSVHAGYTGLLVGRSIVGVTEGDSDPVSFVPVLAELYRQGRLPLDRPVTTYPFSEINQAAADAREGRTIKPVLVFDAG